MRLSHLINTFMTAEATKGIKALPFRPGQIFQGQILHIYSDEIALVQLSDLKLYARLEARLSAGEWYWFEVQSTQPAVLKVLTRPSDGSAVEFSTKEEGIDVLLDALGLPVTPKNQEIAASLVERQVPITAPLLRQAWAWLANTPDLDKAVWALHTMSQRQLPLTRSTYESLIAYADDEPLGQTLANLARGLASLPHQPPAIVDLRRALHKLIDIFASVGDTPLGKNTDLQQPANTAAPLAEKPTAELTGEVEPALTPEKWSKTPRQGVGPVLNPTIVGPPMQGCKQPRTKADVYNGLQEQQDFTDAPASVWSSGSRTLQAFKLLLSVLGLEHERQAFRTVTSSENVETEGREGPAQEVSSVKALLIKALNEEGLTEPIRSTIEHLLNRLTGQQLLSVHHSNVETQVLLQLPLPTGQGFADLTVQWTGRRLPNGQVDPAFCRILFYLNLEYLKDLVVDLSISNRVITMRVISDEPQLGDAVQHLRSGLEQGLAGVGYHLLSLQVVNKAAWEPRAASTDPKKPDSLRLQGVDILA